MQPLPMAPPNLHWQGMAVMSSGEVVGSISGGFVEGAVVEEAQAVLRDGRPRLLTYGVADELATTVGLTCRPHWSGPSFEEIRREAMDASRAKASTTA